jgi:hypothetical protein
LGTLVGKDLHTGDNTVWVWGYGAGPKPDVAKVLVKILPNYYVKHIEVAQALSPIERFPDLGDPLAASSCTPTWTVPKVADFPIALMANRSTMVRVYIGDANLLSGTTASRTVHLRIAVGGNRVVEGDPTMQVSAVDRAPDQRNPNDGYRVWVLASQTAGPAQSPWRRRSTARRPNPSALAVIRTGTWR